MSSGEIEGAISEQPEKFLTGPEETISLAAEC